MKKFHVHVITISQCFIAAGVLILVLILLFSANIVVQKASINLSAQNQLPLIILDAGHGGEDGGAQSADGLLEKDLNLQICEKLNALLQMLGFRTLMVREDDSLHYDAACKKMREKKVQDIQYRFSLMKNNTPCIFLSIHQNHFSDPKYDGAQVFYSANHPQSQELAQAIQNTIVSDLQQGNTRMIKPCGKEIYLLYHAEQPAVMIECGFLSNVLEAQKLNDSNYQTQMALCIANGLVEFFKNGT